MTLFSSALPDYASRAPRKTSLLGWLFAADAVWRSRQRLGSLDAHLLEDIGLTNADAKTENSRGIWDVPSHWTQ